MLEWLHSNICN